MNNRWWVYQQSRFPLFVHGPMVVLFCLAVLAFSSLHREVTPDLRAVVAASLSALVFFFQLRVADEFKDFEIDSAYRPYRPVPSGLVSLRELAWLAFAGAALQFAIAVSIDVGLVPLLGVVWLYIGLMTREFFVAEWLKSSPVAYLLSHMVVMPLIAFYSSAFDWLVAGYTIPGGMGWVLLLAFACGIVLEVGRKVRAPDAEREGVETYSKLWGGRVSVLVWASAASVSVFAYLNASSAVPGGPYAVVPGVLAAVTALGIAWCLLAGARQGAATRWIEPCSAVVVILLYGGLGPLLFFTA